MGEIHILAHSRKIGVTYFRNVAQKALRRNFYVMSMNYYLKWLKILKGYKFGRNNSPSTSKIRSLYAGKCIMIKRISL